MAGESSLLVSFCQMQIGRDNLSSPASPITPLSEEVYTGSLDQQSGPESPSFIGGQNVPSHTTPTIVNNVKQASTSCSGVGNNNTNDGICRIVFLGSGKVGKTSLIMRFLHNQFDTKYTPTIEDLHPAKYIVRQRLVNLEIMDTSGSYDFPAMMRLCIQRANAFVIVFANDNDNSLIQAGHLLDQIKLERKDYAPLGTSSVSPPRTLELYGEETWSEKRSPVTATSTATPPIVVVCNKSDIPPADSQISEGAIMEWLLTHGLKPSQFVYASAKTNEAVRGVFESLWTQNEASQAFIFEKFESERRCSASNQALNHIGTSHQQQHKQHTLSLKNANWSSGSSSGGIFGGGSGGLFGEKGIGGSSGVVAIEERQRSGFFRNSMRVSKRSSSKHSKTRPDIIRLECVIS